MIKKSLLLLIILLPVISAIPYAMGAQLDIKKEVVMGDVIRELDDPAYINLFITNNGGSDTFEVYTLVGGMDLLPRYNFPIESGKTEKVEVEIRTSSNVRKNYGDFKFLYNIRGSASGITDDTMTIRIVPFEEAVEIMPLDINLGDQVAKIKIKNNADFWFKDFKIGFESVLFNYEAPFSLEPKGERVIEIPLTNLEGKAAGSYILRVSFSRGDFVKRFDEDIRYLEKPSTDTSNKITGFFILKKEIEKTNNGNVPTVVSIDAEKNIISRLFTRFGENPDSVKREGFAVYYSWNKELDPGKSLKVTLYTNWLYPFVIVIFIIVIIFILKLVFVKDVIIEKRVVPVKTKGGEFALKIIGKVTANKTVDKVNVVDRLPPLVRLHDKFDFPPDKIHENIRKLEWNIPGLVKGQEKSFSYIVYSNIAPVGKFELPYATVIYERNGKIVESRSNKVFFLPEVVK